MTTTPVRFRSAVPSAGVRLQPGEPLWKCVPTRGEDGCRLVDFMMFIPRLRLRSETYIRYATTYIQAVLGRYDEVVFADINLNLNVLWVSHRHRPGLMLEVAHAIRLAVPEAVLVAQNPGR
jgi:hypothetical protein